MLKQAIAELRCFERKIKNLEQALDTKDPQQIEIEFSNVKNEFESLQDAIYCANEDLEDVEQFVPISIILGGK